MEHLVHWNVWMLSYKTCSPENVKQFTADPPHSRLVWVCSITWASHTQNPGPAANHIRDWEGRAGVHVNSLRRFYSGFILGFLFIGKRYSSSALSLCFWTLSVFFDKVKTQGVIPAWDGSHDRLCLGKKAGINKVSTANINKNRKRKLYYYQYNET